MQRTVPKGLSLRRINDMQLDARSHFERYDLQRAMMYAARLTELERACQGTSARLRRAPHERASHRGD
jgi:hypothetical protein